MLYKSVGRQREAPTLGKGSSYCDTDLEHEAIVTLKYVTPFETESVNLWFGCK